MVLGEEGEKPKSNQGGEERKKQGKTYGLLKNQIKGENRIMNDAVPTYMRVESMRENTKQFSETWLDFF